MPKYIPNLTPNIVYVKFGTQYSIALENKFCFEIPKQDTQKGGELGFKKFLAKMLD